MDGSSLFTMMSEKRNVATEVRVEISRIITTTDLTHLRISLERHAPLTAQTALNNLLIYYEFFIWFSQTLHLSHFVNKHTKKILVSNNTSRYVMFGKKTTQAFHIQNRF